jgi:hypothetical protein
MRYLVTQEGMPPMYTKWFHAENNFVNGMVVYDLREHLYTTDGHTWQDIRFDHL